MGRDFASSTDADISDPLENIVQSSRRVEDRRTMNCHSQHEQNHVADFKAQGSCLQMTELEPLHPALTAAVIPSEVHTVDFDFSPPPQYAHFVSIDGGGISPT